MNWEPLLFLLGLRRRPGPIPGEWLRIICNAKHYGRVCRYIESRADGSHYCLKLLPAIQKDIDDEVSVFMAENYNNLQKLQTMPTGDNCRGIRVPLHIAEELLAENESC